MCELKNYLPATSYLVILVGVLFLSVNVWAQEQEFDKSSSLTLEKDSKTATWTGICDASLSGVDPTQTYSGRLLVFVTPSTGPTTFLIDESWEVSSQDRTFTNSSPGIWTVRVKFTGRTITLQAQVTFGSLNANDRMRCDFRFNRGAVPAPPSEQGLFGARMETFLDNP